MRRSEFAKRALMVIALGVVGMAGTAGAQVATFDSYAEGSLNTGFVDSASGITFSNATTATHNFTIDYVGTRYASTLPRTAGGNILASVGYAPGDGFGLPANFGFTATLPSASASVQLDVLHSTTTGSVTLNLFDAAGQTIRSQAFSLAGPGFTAVTIGLNITSNNIYSFSIVPDANSAVGYDNLIVPEPATLVALPLAAVGFGRRRRVG